MTLTSYFASLSLDPATDNALDWQPRPLSISLDVVDTFDQLSGLPKALASTLVLSTATSQEACCAKSTSELGSGHARLEFWPEFISENAGLEGMPTLCQLTSTTVMTAPDAVKKTLLYTLAYSNGAGAYRPGDSFGILPPNPKALVMALLARLGCSEQAHVQQRAACGSTLAGQASLEPCLLQGFHVGLYALSLYELFSYALDLYSFPKKSLCRYLGDHCQDAREKKYLYYLSSRLGSDHYMRLKEERPSLFDLLQAFPSCSPPLPALIEFLLPQPPRYYSIASSPLVQPESLSFCFNVITESECGSALPQRKGLCSGWLESFHTEAVSPARACLPVLFRKSPTPFALPDNVALSLIFVCAGTGLAPFIGFLAHRKAQRLALGEDQTMGPIFLFYGCRHAKKDFLFEKELERFKADGLLSHLSVCCSRDAEALTGKKHYVQHALLLHARQIYDMMVVLGSASLFVCGDANGMFKDVHETLLSILQSEGQWTLPEAQKVMAGWIESKRYLREVWSS